MQKERFAFDFYTLPRDYFKKTSLSNLTEAIRSEEMNALLRLCDVAEKDIHGSDYVYFSSVCKVFAHFVGHPLHDHIAALLKERFSLSENLSSDNCPEIWRQTADMLFESPLKALDLLPREECAWLCDGVTLPALPSNVTPVLNAALLLETGKNDLAAWQAEILEVITDFSQKGCHTVLLTLPYDFAFVMPDVYHVGQALTKRNRSCVTRSLLLAQLTRFLCEKLLKTDMRLHLRVECRGGEAVALLSYVESCVGLPFFAWSAPDSRDWDALLAFVSRPMRAESRMCLWTSDIPEKEAAISLLRLAASRYPMRRICFAANVDMRRYAQENARLYEMLTQLETLDKACEKN